MTERSAQPKHLRSLQSIQDLLSEAVQKPTFSLEGIVSLLGTLVGVAHAIIFHMMEFDERLKKLEAANVDR